MTKKVLILCIMILIHLSYASAGSEKKKIVFLIGATDSIPISQAINELKKIKNISKKYSFFIITDFDIRKNIVDKTILNQADIIIGDFMKREVDEILANTLKNKQMKVYSLRCSFLANNLKRKGILVDPVTEKYYTPGTVENIKSLISLTLSKAGENISYAPPFILPKSGIFHPESEILFSHFDDYLSWYKKTKKYKPNHLWTGVHTFSTSVIKKKGKIEAHIITSLENQGINVLPVFGRPPYHECMETFFMDKNGISRIHSIIGFGFRFLKGYPEKTKEILKKINAPVFIPLTAHSITIDQWEKSDQGISPVRVAWQICVPEQSGAIEPSMAGGKIKTLIPGLKEPVFDTVPMPENIDFMIKRIKAWHNLKQKKNRDKKIALLYWNHPPGKQNIGGSYMNCFRSISNILNTLKKKNYSINGNKLSEDDVKKLILLGGRNVGSWAPGELEKEIAHGSVIRIPVSTYKKWFRKLPGLFQDEVIKQWGEPEKSDIMIKNSEIILPRINLGNVILMPQPSRGFGEDPEKLYHDPKIYPHHQYIAFYMWLKKEFKADGIISLGKHGTHEWLPGKQIGLSLNCPPDILIQDIPNIYPYIVDNIGEGIQAKRRGRGVIIDHLIPALKKSGSYMEYRKLTAFIDAYHNSKIMDGALAEEKMKTVQNLIVKLGLNKDLELKELNDEAIEKVEHYILEIQEQLVPYGMHTFGISPKGQPLSDLTEAIHDSDDTLKKEKIKNQIKASGQNELDSLTKALEGGYVEFGEGNDPVRNPNAVPTGRNFFGFNIDKVPSKEAYKIGKKMADEMIQKYYKEHQKYPDKLGIILWSTELQRNEGASVGAVLNLIGVTPVWNKKNLVTGVKIIPKSILKRPRIDVLVQSSGLFRDSYAKIIDLMDDAFKKAGAVTDVENFIAKNNLKIKEALLKKGYTKEDAENISRARIFAPMPGAYSHALQDLIPNSGVWENETEITDVFIHHYSYAYGKDIWGKPLKNAYKENLKNVKMTMHTRSSNVYNMLDNDDMFAFLGGLTMAVKSQSDEYPDAIVANLRNKKEVKINDLEKTIGMALRTRYLNPEWIEGMKKEGYSGAKLMDEFVENLWGFQVTTPYAVDKTYWEQIHDVYIQDKYKKNLKEFFDKNNPWALQSISARMLEADRKKYWEAPEKMKKNLAVTYAKNVIEKGVACCEHTCNNPMFQQYVTNVLSLYGLLSSKQLDQFKMILAKATGKNQEELIKDYKKMRASLAKTVEKIQIEENVKAKTTGNKVEGFEMVEEKVEKTETVSSGSSWVVICIVLFLIFLFLIGIKRKKF